MSAVNIIKEGLAIQAKTIRHQPDYEEEINLFGQWLTLEIFGEWIPVSRETESQPGNKRQFAVDYIKMGSDRIYHDTLLDAIGRQITERER